MIPCIVGEAVQSSIGERYGIVLVLLVMLHSSEVNDFAAEGKFCKCASLGLPF